ncbi:GTP-binding protein [Streptomyces sp. NPDC087228]|uniref:GTP-binding protein n=1 Tax=Streptomyces sp. NPDC087228 TaxID=3365772 RepID=UPI0037F408CA
MHISRTLNIGILAHVDAGKTSLTERLLYNTGAIAHLGSVDAGSTQTDTGATERERGITIRAAVAAFTVGGSRVNLIDTPGHTDFVAEVERALGVLDGAILVLSAVEGVQAHTRVLMRVLRAMELPTLLFVNKIDRSGARYGELLDEVRRYLAPRVVVMAGVRDLGTRDARVLPGSLAEPAFRDALGEILADCDDTLLRRVVDGPPPTPAQLWAGLVDQTGRGLVHPVYFGSALSGQGVGDLIDGITGLLPPSTPTSAGSEPAGTVFAVERGQSGAKTALVRLFSGEVAVRQRVVLHRPGVEGSAGETVGQVTSLQVVGGQGEEAAGPLTAGNIGRIGGLPGVRVGDRIGLRGGDTDRAQPWFRHASLEAVVRPAEDDPAAAARLAAAMAQLADQDPLIGARVQSDGAIAVLLHGEIQKEVLTETLERDFGVRAVFSPSHMVCRERPSGVGEACEEIGRRAPSPGGFWATVGLRVEPGGLGDGVVFGYETELGALPRAFHCAIEETVHASLRRGPRGTEVTDCRVTLVRSGFVGPLSTAGDFRGATEHVLRRALERAGTRLHEPYEAYEVETPLGDLSPVTACLGACGATVTETVGGADTWLLRGTLPARAVPEVARRLPGLTRGEGVWWSRPCGDRPVDGTGAGQGHPGSPRPDARE